MTNEEARDILQEQIDKYGEEYDAEGIEALEMAIKALEEEPQEDCVSRQAVSKLLNDGWIKGIYPQDAIMALPSVKPQRAKGHLVSNQQDGEVKAFWERYRCSVCGEYAQDNFNYCSRCGAELEGEEEA